MGMLGTTSPRGNRLETRGQTTARNSLGLPQCYAVVTCNRARNPAGHTESKPRPSQRQASFHRVLQPPDLNQHASLGAQDARTQSNRSTSVPSQRGGLEAHLADTNTMPSPPRQRGLTHFLSAVIKIGLEHLNGRLACRDQQPGEPGRPVINDM